MNTNQMKQRLIEAALTDAVPPTPAFAFPQAGKPTRWRRVVIPAGAIAAIAIAAIVLPLALKQPATLPYEASIDDATRAVEGAFSMISQHFSADENLIDYIE